MSAPIYIALLHYPVLNKHGETVTTSITNFDLHDLGRTTKTYGVKKYFIVTPNKAQQSMVQYIRHHWCEGSGAQYNPDRKEALEHLTISDNLADTCLTIKDIHGTSPQLVATTAREAEKATSFNELKQLIAGSDLPFLILFGTGWGMTPEVFKKVDFVLTPIRGVSEYNHLPVRSAVAIILDRLLRRD